MPKHLYEYAIDSKKLGQRKGFIIQVEDGFGEIAPLPGWSQETLEETRKELFDYLFSKIPPKSPSAQFGIASAKTAFSTKPLKIPLCSLNTPKNGCHTLKIKIGHMTPHQAIEYVKPHIGKYRLRLDCNQMWTLQEAIFFASFFQKTDFEYLEEPTQSSDLIRFVQETDFPIAIDETFRQNPDVYQKLPNVKAIIMKPTLFGHIPHSTTPIVLSSSYESSLGLLQIARQAHPQIAHGLDTFEDFNQSILFPPLKAENGYLIWEGSQSPIDFSKLCLIATAP